MSAPDWMKPEGTSGVRAAQIDRDHARQQAIIEHRRTMRDVRRWQAENRERIDAEWEAMTSPPRTIAGHLAHAREQMGEERWNQLQAEWATPSDKGDEG